MTAGMLVGCNQNVQRGYEQSRVKPQRVMCDAATATHVRAYIVCDVPHKAKLYNFEAFVSLLLFCAIYKLPLLPFCAHSTLHALASAFSTCFELSTFWACVSQHLHDARSSYDCQQQ